MYKTSIQCAKNVVKCVSLINCCAMGDSFMIINFGHVITDKVKH